MTAHHRALYERTLLDLAARKKRKRQLVQQYIWERCKRGQI